MNKCKINKWMDIISNTLRFKACLYCLSAIGQEYPAIVEFAPFQKTAKKRSKKKDAKCGTITEGKIFTGI